MYYVLESRGVNRVGPNAGRVDFLSSGMALSGGPGRTIL